MAALAAHLFPNLNFMKDTIEGKSIHSWKIFLILAWSGVDLLLESMSNFDFFCTKDSFPRNCRCIFYIVDFVPNLTCLGHIMLMGND